MSEQLDKAIAAPPAALACQYPGCVDNSPDGKCVRWLTDDCKGPKAEPAALAVPADACPACGKNWGEHRIGYSASSCKQKPAALADAVALAARLDKTLGCHADSMPKEAYFEVDAVMRALQAQQLAAAVPDDAMVERALKVLAFEDDGAVFPDAYSDEEAEAERDKMRKVLAAALAQQPAAAVPEGIDGQLAKVRADDELANAKRVVSRCINALLDIKVMIEEGDYDEAVSHIEELTEGAAMLAAAERKGGES